MAQAVCEILQVSLSDEGLTARVDLPARMAPAPGQYLLASSLSGADILPTALYLAAAEDDGIELCGDLPAHWTPGEKVWLRGPAGNGFHLPARARRVALIALSGQVARLLPLASQAVARQAAVSLFSERLPVTLPAEVEALPLQALADAWSWADYAAVEARLEQVDQLGRLLCLEPSNRPPIPAEILVYSRFACAGAADCGVCALKISGRYRLCCKDGPVFELQTLDY